MHHQPAPKPVTVEIPPCVENRKGWETVVGNFAHAVQGQNFVYGSGSSCQSLPILLAETRVRFEDTGTRRPFHLGYMVVAVSPGIGASAGTLHYSAGDLTSKKSIHHLVTWPKPISFNKAKGQRRQMFHLTILHNLIAYAPILIASVALV